MKTLKQLVMAGIRDLPYGEIISLHNAACDSANSDDHIYPLDSESINMIFDDPWDMLRNIERYNAGDSYFYLHNGNLCTFYFVDSDESPIVFGELADFVIDNCEHDSYIDSSEWQFYDADDVNELVDQTAGRYPELEYPSRDDFDSEADFDDALADFDIEILRRLEHDGQLVTTDDGDYYVFIGEVNNETN